MKNISNKTTNETYIELFCETLNRNLIFQIDSGADLCIVSEHTVTSQNLNKEDKVTFSGVTPNEFTSLGSVRLKFKLPIRSFTTTFHVSDIPLHWHDGILGKLFLKQS